MIQLQTLQTVLALTALTILMVGLLYVKYRLQQWGRACRIPE